MRDIVIKDLSFAEIQIGDTAEMSRTITAAMVDAFAETTGDYNPVHVDEEFAKTTMFKERIAHGMLSASLVSAVLGTRLPGMNTVYLKQELTFKRPVKIGDTITATVEVLEKNEKRSWLTLRTTVKNQDNVLILDGQATVMKK